LRSQAITG